MCTVYAGTKYTRKITAKKPSKDVGNTFLRKKKTKKIKPHLHSFVASYVIDVMVKLGFYGYCVRVWPGFCHALITQHYQFRLP